MKIIRNTGLLGFSMGINLVIERVETRDVVRLRNNESCVVDPEKEPVKLSAGMWPFGSKRIEVINSQKVEIKTNPVALIMYLISLFIIFIGASIDNTNTKLTISVIGLALLIITFIYSVKRWFIFKQN